MPVIYRETERACDPARRLRELCGANGRDLLADLGQLEAAIADALSPELDEDGPLARELRETTCAAARGERVTERLERLASRPLPARVCLRPQEGFLYYGLFPDAYAAAAAEWLRDAAPTRVVCIGLRTIGAALAAGVAATVARTCPVESVTVRPRGHPFDRRILVGPRLRQRLVEARDAHFAIVDEGPGASGSSFAAAARLLADLGIASERVVLFPSWRADVDALISPAGRACLRAHRQYVCEFRCDWVRGLEGAEEVSAGRWRDHPALRAGEVVTQPQHERRKFFRAGPPACVLRFVGFGQAAARRVERARVLADAGYGPRVGSFADGFLALEHLPGQPASGPELAETIGRYLAFVRREFPSDQPAAPLAAMVDANLARPFVPPDEPPVDLDGRMLPHEWIRSRGRIYKVDAIDHGDDHFFPGPQPIGWDVAAACIEIGDVVAAYVRASGEPVRSLSAWRTAYLAFRHGYARYAAAALASTADGARWAEMSERYARALDLRR